MLETIFWISPALSSRAACPLALIVRLNFRRRFRGWWMVSWNLGEPSQELYYVGFKGFWAIIEVTISHARSSNK